MLLPPLTLKTRWPPLPLTANTRAPGPLIVAEFAMLNSVEIDDKAMRVLSHGLKERAIVLSGIRGQ